MERNYLIKSILSNIEMPFEDDLWERKEVATKLTNYIRRLKVGATLAIDAEWGAGKSWFVKNWQAQLEIENFKVIYLDAFANDFLEDPFLLISMEIAKKLESEQGDLSTFKESIGKVYQSILPNLPMLIWSLTLTLIGGGYFAKNVGDTITNVKDGLGEFGEVAGTILNDQLKEHLSKQIENYDNEQQSLQYFKDELTKLAIKLDEPLVFIIDELDRCKPEFSIRLIERIKHFFEIPNVIFILSINKKQLDESINNYYGFSDKNEYLEKFIDFRIKLKSNKNINYDKMVGNYTEKLGFNLNIYDDFVFLCTIFKPNARQLIKILQKLSFFNLLSFTHNIYAALYLFANDIQQDKEINSDKDLLSLLLEKSYDYYTKHSMNRLVNNDPNWEKNTIERMHSVLGDGISYLLRFYELLNEDQYDELPTHKAAFNPYLSRGKVIGDLYQQWESYIYNGYILDSNS